MAIDLINLGLSDLDIALKRAEILTDLTQKGMLPEFSTGARTKIRINGKLLGAATDVSYTTEGNFEPLQTIDNYMPVEIMPHQCLVRAELKSFIHPDSSAAGDGMFTILQSYLHTPTATLEFVDRLGNLIFAARGSFTSMRGSISIKAASTLSVSFLGYYFRDFTQQSYSPIKLSLTDLLKQKANARISQVTDAISS